MPALQVTRTTDKAPEQLWEVLADFPNIADWFGGVKTSVSTSDSFRGCWNGSIVDAHAA